MNNIIEQQLLSGERALFGGRDLIIRYSTFAEGESPLKESSDIALYHSLFKWKYPLWYSKNIALENCTLFEMARAGIWYTEHISLTNCTVEAPKNFRRTTDITLKNVTFPNASETLWNCDQIHILRMNIACPRARLEDGLRRLKQGVVAYETDKGNTNGYS